jgi:hypothetical protein
MPWLREPPFEGYTAKLRHGKELDSLLLHLDVLVDSVCIKREGSHNGKTLAF